MAAYTLIVWGLDPSHPSYRQQLHVFIEHGCMQPDTYLDVSAFVLQQLNTRAWCAVEFAELAAAEACATDLQEHCCHLQTCIEPDWQALGSSEASATADLIQLAERLGCRDKAHTLPAGPEAVCLARGAAAVLAAIEKAGGMHALAAADLCAATCLGQCITDVAYGTCREMVPSDVSSRLVRCIAQLGPYMLPSSAAEVCEGVAGAPERACAAIRVTHVLLVAAGAAAQPNELLSSEQQGLIASHCIDLLQAVSHALAGSTAAIGMAAQQHRLSESAEQRAARQQVVLELGSHSAALRTAAHCMLCCLRERALRSGINDQELLATLGHLIRQAVMCGEVESNAAAAGLQLEGAVSVPGCLREAHLTIRHIIATSVMGRSAAGLPALHFTVIAALHTALDRCADARHVGLLLGLLLLVRDTEPEQGDVSTICDVLEELSCVQQLAAAWLAADEQLLRSAEHQPFGCGLESFSDHLCLLADIGAEYLSYEILRLLDKDLDVGGPGDPDGVLILSFVRPLATALKVASVSMCRNVRRQCQDLGFVGNIGTCTAPGLHIAACILLRIVQAPHCILLAGSKSAKRRPWVGDVIRLVVHSGIGTLILAHAEAAAQATSPESRRGTAHPRAKLLPVLRRQGAELLQVATSSMTPQLGRTFAGDGLAPALLQVLTKTLRAPPAVLAADARCWDATAQVISAICGLMAAVLAADATARAAMLQEGSWHAEGVHSVMSLQPPAQSAAGWPAQRDALLHKVTAVLGGGGDSKRHADGGGFSSRQAASSGDPAADADAIAAADRAMQELLAEEQQAEALRPCSKALSKRARKKAAKQQAAASTQAASGTADPVATASPATSLGLVAAGCSSLPLTDVLPIVAASPASTIASGSPGMENAPPEQPAAAAGAVAAGSDSNWWRCPLSGRIMRDPVLYGSGGHSFEREALEAWLKVNPGMDPDSEQPLLLGADTMLPNHALRNVIQQLHLG